MSIDIAERFQTATTAERLTMIGDADTRDQLRAALGDPAVEAYRRLAAALPDGAPRLGESAPANLIFVPGVMGSVLVSRSLGGVWWLDLRSRGRLDQLGLSADGTHDAHLGARIAAVAVDASYDAFCAAALAREDFGHVTLPYDWRRPIPAVVGGLRDLIDSMYEDNGHQPVHLVAHSMGGLVVRETLRQHPALWERVGRIAFLGTPHYGSPAIAGYLKNHLWGFELLALLGRYLSRPTLRSLWGVLDLLPAPVGVYPGTRDHPSGLDQPSDHPCANFDLFDAGAYRLGLSSDEQGRLQRALDAAKGFHTDLYTWHMRLLQEQRDRMLVIAGVGYKTLFRIAYQPAFGFLWEHMDRVTRRRAGDADREGDGRVPLASALLEHVGDTRFVHAEHGELPAIPAVQSGVFAWLRGERPALPRTSSAALAATLGDEGPALAPELRGLHAHPHSEEDPGYLDLEPIDDARLDRVDDDAGEGRLPALAQIKIL